MPECNPVVRPSRAIERELSSRGFGLKEVAFTLDNDILTVTSKIYSAFKAMLSGITGGIQMFVTEARHTLNLKTIHPVDPVVPGVELKRSGKVYVARLQDNIEFPNVVRLSRVNVKCPSCLKMFDQNLIRFHRDICNENSENSSSSEEIDDGVRVPELQNPLNDVTVIDFDSSKKDKNVFLQKNCSLTILLNNRL